MWGNRKRHRREQQKATQAGMIARDIALCVKCSEMSAVSELFHGWCQACMEEWRATADPVMLAQSSLGYAPPKCLPAPSDDAVGRILEFLTTPKVDKEYLTLLLYNGRGTVGRMQSMWNFCKTMELLELRTSGDVLKLTKASHDVVHRCGLHAPVQRTTLDSFFARVIHSKDFAPAQRDKRLVDYMQTFAHENRFWLFPLKRISAISDWKTTRAWRTIPKLAYKPLTAHWPFLHKEAAKDHLDIMLVDSLIPKGIPEQWRQDMCQDLFVSILSGEIEPDELRSSAKYHIKKIWQQHPYKYGPLSLDAPLPVAAANGGHATLLDVLSERSIAHIETCHLECEPEPRPLNTIGDLLRGKNNGVAIPTAVQAEPDWEMDDELQEVYRSEVLRK